MSCFRYGAAIVSCIYVVSLVDVLLSALSLHSATDYVSSLARCGLLYSSVDILNPDIPKDLYSHVLVSILNFWQ